MINLSNIKYIHLRQWFEKKVFLTATRFIGKDVACIKIKTLQYILLGLIILISCQSNTEFSEFQNGDIIFQTSKSEQSKAIQIATNSKYSHMGIIYMQKNKFYVYEAVQPVKLTPLNDWINRGKNSHYVVKRLKYSEKLLTDKHLAKMRTVGERFSGKDYDLYFEWTDSRIYCSELVWKIYKEAIGIEIGKLEMLGDFILTDKAVKEKLKERYGDNIPKNELVISPASMFNSDLLITIFEN